MKKRGLGLSVEGSGWEERMVGGFRLRQQAVAARETEGPQMLRRPPCAGGQAAGGPYWPLGPQPPLPPGPAPTWGAATVLICALGLSSAGPVSSLWSCGLNGRMRLRPIILSYPFSDWLAVRAEGLGDRGGVFLPYTELPGICPRGPDPGRPGPA